MGQTWYHCIPDTNSNILNKLFYYNPYNYIEKPKNIYNYVFVCCCYGTCALPNDFSIINLIYHVVYQVQWSKFS